MPIILVSSNKGGVGRTTVTANLAAGFAARGLDVTALDIDPQGSLGFHFGVLPGECPATLDGVATRAGVRLIAHGEAALAHDAAEAKSQRRLTAAMARWASSSAILVIDTPAAPTPLSRALAGLADLTLTVFLADAASMISVQGYASGPGDAALINQVDHRRRLSQDATDFLGARAGAASLYSVRRDEAAAEALAALQPVITYASASAAAGDFVQLAERLELRLGLTARAEVQQAIGA